MEGDLVRTTVREGAVRERPSTILPKPVERSRAFLLPRKIGAEELPLFSAEERSRRTLPKSQA